MDLRLEPEFGLPLSLLGGGSRRLAFVGIEEKPKTVELEDGRHGFRATETQCLYHPYPPVMLAGKAGSIAIIMFMKLPNSYRKSQSMRERSSSDVLNDRFQPLGESPL
jgi:hypothetical protein